MADLITQCSWCKRVRCGDSWVTVFVPADADNITHGLCPRCFKRVDEEIKKAELEESESTPPPRPF